MLIESLVMSRIHYCCSLYYGLPATSTKSLDRIIRSSIRVLPRVELYDHESVNYHLVNSKWLNMYQRSTFSYLKLIFKVLKNRLPSYLNDILQFKVYKRNLRNASTRLLQEKKYKLSRYDKRSFSVAATDLRNALPVGLITNANYSYLKTNLLLLISTNLFYYFQLIYLFFVFCYFIFFFFFLHNIERLTLFLCINKHSIQLNSIYNCRIVLFSNHIIYIIV